MKRQRAFTLIELLVVVAIIAILIAVLLPSLSKARLSAKQVRTASDLHQMTLAYAQYTAENDDQVLLGFIPTGTPWTVSPDIAGLLPVSGQPALRYPWRLLPYFKDWRILFQCPPLSNDDVNTFSYQMSLLPRFGLNSMFVGGDIRTSSLTYTGGKLWATGGGGSVVFKGAEVRNPSRLIVFGETGGYINGKLQAYAASTLPGSCPPEALSHYFQLWPPRVRGIQNWHAVSGDALTIDATGFIMGALFSPEAKRPVMGFFDGHAEAMNFRELDDMRLWANKADAPDYNYVP